MKKVFFSFILLFSINSFSQKNYGIVLDKVYGVVLDGETKEPLVGASVYFNNTTLGASTNNKGEFSLYVRKKIKTPLVVSFIGYISLPKEDVSVNKKLTFYLYKSNNLLNEAVINTNDGWSRNIKMNEFLKHFLGNTVNGRACEVKNKEDVLLRYNKTTKQLTAQSDVPIIVKNPNLGFLISVELKHFEVNYSYVSKNNKTRTFDKTYYSSTNFFKSVDESSKTINKRKKTYKGSLLHFMRALSKNKLLRNGYELDEEGHYRNIYTKFVNPKRYIEIQETDSLGVKVHLKRKLKIVYKNGGRSMVESLVDAFFIDSFGNHSPIDKVIFEGDLGNQRIGDTLPLDFLLKNK